MQQNAPNLISNRQKLSGTPFIGSAAPGPKTGRKNWERNEGKREEGRAGKERGGMKEE